MSPCIFCEANNSELKYKTVDVYKDTYEVRGCNNCESVFISPRPDSLVLAKAYDSAYYGNRQNKFVSWIEKPLDLYRTRKAKLVTKYLKGPASVLDIGCGNGDFLSNVQKQGDFKIFGVEMPGRAAIRAEKIPHLKLKIGALNEDDFKANSFDAITLFHVFEHLTEPRKTLDIIDNILMQDGVLAMSFPNISSWQSRCFKGDWLHLDPPRHLFFMSPRNFKKEMDKRGYTCIEENYFSPEYNPYGYSQSILNKLTGKRDVLYEALKGNSINIEEYSVVNLFFQKMFFVLTVPFFMILDAIESLFKQSATVEFVLRKRN